MCGEIGLQRLYWMMTSDEGVQRVRDALAVWCKRESEGKLEGGPETGSWMSTPAGKAEASVSPRHRYLAGKLPSIKHEPVSPFSFAPR